MCLTCSPLLEPRHTCTTHTQTTVAPGHPAGELAQIGLAPRVVELLKRPAAPTALPLLAILRCMLDATPRRAEFVSRHRLLSVLHAMAHNEGAVLVAKQAAALLEDMRLAGQQG